MRITTWALALIGLTLASPSMAQTFSNTTTGTIGNATSCPGATAGGATLTTANLVRDFNVSGIASVDFLDVGFITSHTWRGDIRMILRPPSGAANEVTLLAEDTSGAGNDDNYNIRLSDAAATVVNTGDHDVANDINATPYQFTVRPSNAGVLSTFAGTDPTGTWSLIMCDTYGGQEGTFQSAELIFSQPEADMIIGLSASSASPEQNSSVNLLVTARNDGPSLPDATVQVNLPSGLSYISHSGPGTYDSLAGIWTLPTDLPVGATQTLSVNVLVQSIGSYTATAEVASSDFPDPDSTPNNNSTTEDDDDTFTFSPTPPLFTSQLTCPASSQFSLNWADRTDPINGWTTSALTESYTVAGRNMDFALTGATNRFIPRTYGGATFNTPASEDQFANGSADFGVLQYVQMLSTTETANMTFTVGTPGQGVDQLEFEIRDVDNGTDGSGFEWVDRVTISGSLDGTAVTPVITTGVANTNTGSTILGTASSATGSSDGNVLISFTSPVDTVSYSYGNSGTTATLAVQIISLQRITMCPPLTAELTAVKTVEVNDPGGLGLYMTPGNEVLYKISATNAATATADAEDVDIQDTLPSNLKFISASTTGFTGGAFGSPDLPATNQDCGVTPCVVRFSGAEVPIGVTGVVIVIAEIK